MFERRVRKGLPGVKMGLHVWAVPSLDGPFSVDRWGCKRS